MRPRNFCFPFLRKKVLQRFKNDGSAEICLKFGDLLDGDREGDVIVGHAAPREQELVYTSVAANVETATGR